MKNQKTSILALFLLLFFSFSSGYAQTDLGNLGAIPDACAGQDYTQVLALEFPADTMIIIPPFPPLTVPISSITIDNVTGIPAGLSAICAPASCTFTPSGGIIAGAVGLTGNSTAPAGTYTVNIEGTVNLLVFGSVTSSPVTASFDITILDSSDAACGTSTIPTLSQWGLIVLTLSVMCFGAVLLVRRRELGLIVKA